MRISEGGDDEVNIDMIHAGCPEVQEAFVNFVIGLREHSEAKKWNEEMVVSKLIMLWKGKGSRADLDKY